MEHIEGGYKVGVGIVTNDLDFIEQVPEDVRSPASAKSGRGRSPVWDRIGDQLRANPGRWALVKRNSNRLSLYTFRSGRGPAALRPGEEFEFSSRVDFEQHRVGYCDIYARYTGPRTTEEEDQEDSGYGA